MAEGPVRAGTWIAARAGGRVASQGTCAERGDLHAPQRGKIDDRSGNPHGVFFGAGVRLAYVFGIGLP